VNDPDNVVDPVVLAERRARRAELAEEELRELLRETELGAATLKGRLAAVEGELATARAQRDAFAADLARREKELIASSQREHAEQALRSEAQTRAAEAETGSRRELDELRARLAAAEQRATLLTDAESDVAERLERARAAEDELVALRGELQSRQTEIGALREELERYAEEALRAPDASGSAVDPELLARITAERTAFAAQVAAVEHTVAGMRPQLAAAATALAEQLAAERAARAEAERALEDERARVEDLQAQLAAATSRESAITAVVAELAAAVDELRERFASELDAKVAALSGTADALRSELSEEQRLRSTAAWELERLHAAREEAEAELERERERRATAEAELERRRAEHATAQDEHATARDEHASVQAELERERDQRAAAQAELNRQREEHAASQADAERRQEEHSAAQTELDRRRAELERRQAEHIAVQAELAREQAQHAAAQSELGREQALRSETEAELVRERERLEAANAELEALRAAPPPAPSVDIAEFTRAAERLRAQTEEQPAVSEPEPEPPVAAAAPAPTAAAERRDELARILAAQQAAAASAAAPDRLAHLPDFPVKAVVPWAAGEGAWLREGISRAGRADPALGAQLLLALVPVQAHVARRPVAYRLTVGDVGTWRVELRDMEATIEPDAPAGKVAFRLSGSPGELAAALAGGGRRKLTAHVEGSRLALWRVARARRQAPTLAQAVAAGGELSLRAVLALLATVAPEGGRSVVAFDDGESPITAVATRRGAIVLRSGIEQPQATLHAPAQELVALLVGLAPAVPIRVAGDVTQATAFVTRLHRAQGLV
jgi:hypothetical protein